MPLGPGDPAPEVPGAAPADGARVLFFYKVTCPTCQLAAPVAERLHRAFPGRLVGVGQDPPEKLSGFAERYGTSFDAVSDDPPYETSNAYGVRTVPTLFVVEEGRVVETVESWDRDAWNGLARALAERTGAAPETLSHERDGLPPFKPG